MDLKLKTVASITTTDDNSYPFTLQSIGNVLIHRQKHSIEIVQLKRDYFSQEMMPQFTNVKTETPVDAIQLPVQEKTIFDHAGWNEKNMLMFNPYLLPSCSLKNTHYIKSISTQGDSIDEVMVAALTTAGIIEFYEYNLKTQKLLKLPLDLMKLRIDKEAIKKEIKTYDMLKSVFNRVAFANIEWCPVTFDNFKLFYTATKSDEIHIYSISDDKAIDQLKINFADASTSEVKWTSSPAFGHNIFVGMTNGNLMRFSLKIQKDGKIKSNETEEIFGKIKIPPSFIYIDYIGSDIIIICCKNHTLEIFLKSGLRVKTISKRIGLSITGIDSVGHCEYIVTTLSGNVYYIRLHLNKNGELEIVDNQKVEISLPSDEIQQSTKMGFYGVTTSRNKIFVYISTFPRHSTDHLVIKQPSHLSMNLWSGVDSNDILKNNKSLLLTDYADCIEAVRLQGIESINSIEELENMPYELELNESFLYYLKIQLVLINTKISYYYTRSQNILDIFRNSQELMMELIRVIKTYVNLENLLENAVNNEIFILTVRAMKKFLIGYSRKIITAMPYEGASNTFKPAVIALVDKCQAIKVQTAHERCKFCDEEIYDDEETCSKDHKMKRCTITNLMVELDSRDCCPQCLVNVTTEENFKALFGNEPMLCPFCDSFLKFE